MIGLVLLLGLGFAHLLNWLLAKGIIWVMYELFNINWYGKFWIVYVAIIVISTLFKSTVTVKK